MNLEDTGLSPAQIETLLRSPCPLEDVYHDCTHLDNTERNYALCQIVEQRADIEMEKQRAVPIYNGTAQEANERGELDKFKSSAEADDACRVAIENAIARNYDGSRLNTKAAIAEVREQFGDKRLVRVAASLVRQQAERRAHQPGEYEMGREKRTTKKVFTDRTHLRPAGHFRHAAAGGRAKAREGCGAVKNTRDSFLLVHLNNEERERIQARMAEVGTKNMSAFIRKMALDGRIVPAGHGRDKTLVSLLRRTSANVNQIAKRVNSTSRVYGNDLAEIQNRLGEVWLALDDVLCKLAAVE